MPSIQDQVQTAVDVAVSALPTVVDVSQQVATLADGHATNAARIDAVVASLTEILAWVHANFGRGATTSLPSVTVKGV